MAMKPFLLRRGAFKAATRAKAPIVPVALLDSYAPFDRSTTEPVTVQIHYMKPMYYEEYAGKRQRRLHWKWRSGSEKKFISV